LIPRLVGVLLAAVSAALAMLTSGSARSRHTADPAGATRPTDAIVEASQLLEAQARGIHPEGQGPVDEAIGNAATDRTSIDQRLADLKGTSFIYWSGEPRRLG